MLNLISTGCILSTVNVNEVKLKLNTLSVTLIVMFLVPFVNTTPLKVHWVFCTPTASPASQVKMLELTIVIFLIESTAASSPPFTLEIVTLRVALECPPVVVIFMPVPLMSVILKVIVGVADDVLNKKYHYC